MVKLEPNQSLTGRVEQAGSKFMVGPTRFRRRTQKRAALRRCRVDARQDGHEAGGLPPLRMGGDVRIPGGDHLEQTHSHCTRVSIIRARGVGERAGRGGCRENRAPVVQ